MSIAVAGAELRADLLPCAEIPVIPRRAGHGGARATGVLTASARREAHH